MKSVEIIKLINYLENEFPVSQWNVDGLCVWPIVRNQLTIYLDSQEYKEELSESKLPGWIQTIQKIFYNYFKFFNALKSTLIDWRGSQKVEQADAVFLTNTVSRTQLGKKWFDKNAFPLSDIIQKESKFKNLFLELGDSIRIPRYNPSIFLYLWILKYQFIKNKYRKKNFQISTQGHKNIQAYLKSINVGYIISINEIIANYVRVRAWADLFKNILVKVKPKIFFMICYYEDVGFGANLACKEMGITSCDIQHGMQGEYHPSYSSWLNPPQQGYELLPTSFLTWSNTEKRIIDHWAEKTNSHHTAIVIGNLWLELWKNQNYEEIKISINKVHQIFKITDKNKYVLLALQSTHLALTSSLPIIKQIPDDWTILIRLHPNMLPDREVIRNYLTKSDINNFELDYATDLPLPALLSITTVLITEWSSCVLEAKYFGIPSIIIHPNGEKSYKREIAEGYCFKAYTAEELDSTLTKILQMDWQKEEKTIQNHSIAKLVAKLSESNKNFNVRNKIIQK
jgi:hypothetical protein